MLIIHFQHQKFQKVTKKFVAVDGYRRIQGIPLLHGPLGIAASKLAGEDGPYIGLSTALNHKGNTS